MLKLADLLPTAIAILISAFGGTAQLFHSSSKRKKLTLKEYGMKIVVAGFVGFVFFQLCAYLEANSNLTIVIVGISGFAGPSALTPLIDKYIGADEKKDEKK